jgi:TPR repeat protein
MRLALALLLGALATACSRGRSSGNEQPAPSASVITLGVAIGTCPDVPACEKECDAGSADRCRRLAATLAFGQGVDKDEVRATALYEHACDMSDPSACVFAGQMYEFAHGVDKDDARAARLYGRGCDLKYVAGCYNLAIMFERGTGVPQDRAKASCEKAKEMREPPQMPFFDGSLP